MPPSQKGVPSGDSRLSSYFVVIGTIVVTVLIITLHTIQNMEHSYGGWESRAASSIEIREVILHPVEEATSDNNDDNHKNNNNDSSSKNKNNLRASTPIVPKPFPKLLDSVLEAHEQMLQQIKTNYGDDYFEAIFKNHHDQNNDDTPEPLSYLPIRPFGPKDLYFTNHFSKEEKERYETKRQAEYHNSLANLRRKMMIRVLLAHTQQNNGNNNNSNTYVWATGGHSAAAGHGNLFKETYTKVMEATAKGVFEASGLRLEARNYAMGTTSSAAEMSMCFAQIYGQDVDIFSWDFAMLEARDYLSGRLLHYATRGFLSSNHSQEPHPIVPAFVGLQEVKTSRKQMLEELHDAFLDQDENENDHHNNGLALFLRDEDDWKAMKAAIPDNADLTEDEINQLPEFVRHFKCDGALEKGSPHCEDAKYSEEICPNRMGRASWHPGWKYNAMLGNSMALFLTESLVGAIRQIEEELSTTSPEKLLSELIKVEDAHRERLTRASSKLPPSYERTYWYNNTSDDWKNYQQEEKVGLETGSQEFRDRWRDLDRRALFFGPSLCHTARIPSQTRFFGHLTNQPDLTGEQTVFGKETYFTGIEESEYHERNTNNKANNSNSEPHDMQLVWVREKEREESCGDELAKPDYHDYFMAEDQEGWVTLEFPNKAEEKAYGYQKENYKGILIIVPRVCGFGNCEEGFLSVDQYNEGKWTMAVNGKKVTAMTRIGHDAILLEHLDGIYFDPNQEGKYRFEIKVNEPKSFIKISAFVLY